MGWQAEWAFRRALRANTGHGDYGAFISKRGKGPRAAGSLMGIRIGFKKAALENMGLEDAVLSGDGAGRAKARRP